MSINPLESLKTITENYEGIYVGRVESVNDPLRKWRIKVQVMPMFKDIATDLLPWAVPCWSFMAVVPPINSWVTIRFMDGDIYSPMYFGCSQPFGGI